MFTDLIPGWIKTYSDREPLVATDSDIDMKKVSWRNSSFENLTGLTIVNKYGHSCMIENYPTRYWQSTDYLAPLSINKTVKGQIVTRRMQFYIPPGNQKFVQEVVAFGDGVFQSQYSLIDEVPEWLPMGQYPILLFKPEELADKWFTIELSENTNKVRYYLANGMI